MLFTLFSAVSVAATYDYPKPEKSDQTDEYFGKTVADPYRWMEDSADARLKPWIEAENKLTESYLEKIPFRDQLKQRLTETINYPKLSIPWTKKGKRFHYKNDGLQNQSVLYVLDTPQSEPRILLDPNTFSTDGTVSLSGLSVSENAKYLAYSISKSGSDWNEISVITVEDGKPLEDKVEWVKFSGIAWKGNGFYYSRYDAPAPGEELTAKNEYHKIYYHELGTDQNDDKLVYEDRTNPQRNCGASTDRKEQYLFISGSESTYGNSLYFKDLRQPDSKLITILDTFDCETDIVAVIDDKFYALTDRNSPNKRLVLIDPANPTPENWTDVIPHTDSLLRGVWLIGGKFIVSYLRDAAADAAVYDTKGKKEHEIEFPTLGICSFSGEPDHAEYYASFTSFMYPPVISRCNMESGKSEVLFPSQAKIDPELYETKRIWYKNSDGKKVPIFVTHKKGLELDGNNPTLLYGYGGFNASMTPSFSPLRIPFLEKGGVYAVAILRGGGEYGETWHKAGTKLQKQNVFDDFAAAGELLIKEKYTSSQKLAIQGGSNGGLLVGASVTQRPELFRAAICAVGVLDMLRYQKFTIGWAWATDYGTSEESNEMFEYLLGYSPLHNVKPNVNYPAILVTTSDHDDRVVPAHSFKFTATMQEISTSDRPVMIRIETKAGHGAGKPISKVIEESTDSWSFLMDQLGMQ